MPKPAKAGPPAIPGASDLNLLAWLATCVSVFAFLFYYRVGEVLLYGDAIAHINIARRVFDSKTPGLLQLGTVWLPVPHLLMIPFIISREMWRTGAGGSIPSMAGYVFATLGIFRLTRSALAQQQPDRYARFAAWIATIAFAANPNLIYMQSTAMGESVYLAFFLWALVYFTEWTGGANSLTKCGLCLFAACLTRYDGWFLAVTLIAAAILFSLMARRGRAALQGRVPEPNQKFGLAHAIPRFILIATAAPALWLAYNAIVYRNPLEFANGPYSARAIEKRTQVSGNPGHPGSGNPALAAQYFVKSAEDNLAQKEWLQRAWILLGIVAFIFSSRLIPQIARMLGSSPPALLLLLTPLPFYALSIAYGGVPIFIPNWWPFTHYNARYGLQLLPALAASIAVLVYLILRAQQFSARLRLVAVLAISVVVGASYATVWQDTPISLKEAQVNMRTRNQFQVELARWIEKLPPDATLLMYLGDHVGALQRAGFPLKRTINEGNHRMWKQPADVEGLWERALAEPSKYVDYVLAFDGDPVWQAVRDKRLHELVDLHVSGQPRAILYAAR